MVVTFDSRFAVPVRLAGKPSVKQFHRPFLEDLVYNG